MKVLKPHNGTNIHINTKRILTLLSLVLFLRLSVSGQDKAPESLNKNVRINLGFDGIAVAFEPKLSSSLLLELNAGMGGYYNIAEGSFDYNLNIKKPAFHAEISPKYFFGRNRNKAKTELNSGNYLGLSIKYASKSVSNSILSDRVMLYNAHYGIQRGISDHFFWNAKAGIGYADKVSNNFGTVYPALGLKLCYVF